MVRIIQVNTSDDSQFTAVCRRDSKGEIHKTWFLNEQYDPRDSIVKRAGMDSVQITCDGKYRIGDRVRPTEEYIRQCCQGSVPYEMVMDWRRGFRITEIGPAGYLGEEVWHHIELEGCDLLGLSTADIERA